MSARVLRRENKEKVKLNKTLPYLVGNVVEILELEADVEEEEDGSAMDVDDAKKGKLAGREGIVAAIERMFDDQKMSKPRILRFCKLNEESVVIVNLLELFKHVRYVVSVPQVYAIHSIKNNA